MIEVLSITMLVSELPVTALKLNGIICGTFYCIKKYMIILKMCFSVNQIDDLPSTVES